MIPTRVLLSRSVWKGPYVVPHNPNVSSFAFPPLKPGEVAPPIRTDKRSATILPNFVGRRFSIHNGKIYNDVTITEDMVGHKLGEFSPTRKPFRYKQTKNR